MKNIVIAEAPIEDAVKVNSTIIEFDKPYNKTYFEKRYQNKGKLILVAKHEGQLVGYMVSYDRFKDGSIYCWMAGVDPTFRRQGILTKMMKHLEKWAKTTGYRKITIKTRNNRREMLSYLIKSGFCIKELESRPDITDNRILFERDI